jgi:hypothetical protein
MTTSGSIFAAMLQEFDARPACSTSSLASGKS